MPLNIAILGAGESGIGAATLARKKGYDVFLSDAGVVTAESRRALNDLKVEFEEGGHSMDRLAKADLVVKSPGIPDQVPVVQQLEKEGKEIVSEIEFAYRHIDEQSKVIAITGTNGKTTTTLLTYHLLKTAGLKVALGGNVGISLAKLVAKGRYDYYVVEVSSFQLDGIREFKPNLAVLLNITPDHLDRYDNDFSKYVSSKFRITQNLSNEECFIYCADSKPVSEEVAKRKIEACLFAISASKGSGFEAFLDKDHLIFNYKFRNKGKHHKVPLSDISLIGKHNMINSMAAVLSALLMEVSISDILKGLKSFENAPHRLEYVDTIGGIRFVNDSKATNVDAVYYALEGIDDPIIWIAGGVDKGNDYSAVADVVSKKVKAIICLGTNNAPLLKTFKDSVPVMLETESVAEVVDLVLAQGEAGDVALLSPACASFDLFKNYMDRGDQFKEAVRNHQELEKVKA